MQLVQVHAFYLTYKLNFKSSQLCPNITPAQVYNQIKLLQNFVRYLQSQLLINQRLSYIKSHSAKKVATNTRILQVEGSGMW